VTLGIATKNVNACSVLILADSDRLDCYNRRRENERLNRDRLYCEMVAEVRAKYNLHNYHKTDLLKPAQRPSASDDDNRHCIDKSSQLRSSLRNMVNSADNLACLILLTQKH